MTKALFGDKFDIHGGGLDLTFPHHENEKAQSCCEAGEDSFADYWMHNEMLQVEGKKMSKSLGNFFTVRDLLEQGVPGEVIRFVFLSTHYRKPMDWTQKKADEAEKTLERWKRITLGLDPTPAEEFTADQKMLDALGDDLNSHLALVRLRSLQANPQALLDNARVIGLLGDESRAQYADIEKHIQLGVGSSSNDTLAVFAAEFDRLRIQAKISKDFSQVDSLKKSLIDAGVEVRVGAGGTDLLAGPKFDPSKLEGL